MVKHYPVLALVAPIALLGACGPVTSNRGVETVHQPVVERTDYAIDIATNGNGLAPGEAGRLAGWMASLRAGYGDRISVDDPAGYAGGAHTDVALEAGRYGLLVEGPAPVTPGQVQPGTVRVVLSRSTASVPTCPDYSDIYAPNFTGRSTANFGCATNSNLAAMIARPEDLVRGQTGEETSDPRTSTKAISTLRSAAPSGAGGLKSESTGGGQ